MARAGLVAGSPGNSANGGRARAVVGGSRELAVPAWLGQQIVPCRRLVVPPLPKLPQWPQQRGLFFVRAVRLESLLRIRFARCRFICTMTRHDGPMARGWQVLMGQVFCDALFRNDGNELSTTVCWPCSWVRLLRYNKLQKSDNKWKIALLMGGFDNLRKSKVWHSWQLSKLSTSQQYWQPEGPRARIKLSFLPVRHPTAGWNLGQRSLNVCFGRMPSPYWNFFLSSFSNLRMTKMCTKERTCPSNGTALNWRHKLLWSTSLGILDLTSLLSNKNVD